MSIIYPIVLCLVFVALEGFCAGPGIRQRMAELRKPRFVPPLWGWILIGAFYYVMCFVVLYRLFAGPSIAPFTNVAIAGVLLLMLINAGWNWSFFRTRKLRHAFIISVPYTILAVMLFALLLRVDTIAARWFAPYLPYLGYANFWSYRLWRLNPS
jgi:tryptophan-rich sensory protein